MRDPRDYDIGSIYRSMGGYDIEKVPGLYVYSGFGVGTYYSKDGKYYSAANNSEVRERAKEEGVKFRWIDTFDGYRATYLGD